MRDRTADLLRAKQALSQLSYSPIVVKLCYLEFVSGRGVMERSIRNVCELQHNKARERIW